MVEKHLLFSYLGLCLNKRVLFFEFSANILKRSIQLITSGHVANDQEPKFEKKG